MLFLKILNLKTISIYSPIVDLMAESKYKYVLPNKVLEGKVWMTKHNKSSYDIVKINVENPNTNATGQATYYQVHLMLPSSADAPADAPLEKYPLMFLHAAHQCKYGLKEVDKDSKFTTRSIQFGPYSTYELTLKGSDKATVQKYGEAKRWLAGIIKDQIEAYIKKEKIVAHPDIATGVRTHREVTEKGKPKKKIPLENIDEHLCSVEIPFARPIGGGRPSDDTPPSIKIGDAAKPIKSTDGSRSFDAPIVDKEKLNYGNIHLFVLAGSKFMGIEDCGSISHTNVGYSWTHKWMDDIVIRKGTGNTRAVEYKGDLDDSAYAGMGGDEEPEPAPTKAGPKKGKKTNPEDEIITDGGDEVVTTPSKAKAKAKPVVKPAPEPDALEDFVDEQEPPKPTPPKAKAKAKAPVAPPADDFGDEETPAPPPKPKNKPAPEPADDFDEDVPKSQATKPKPPVDPLEAEPVAPKPKKAVAKPAPDPLEDEETPAPPPKPKNKAKAKAPPKPPVDEDFE